MASAYGNTVQHWRALVTADVTGETATQMTIRVRCWWCSIAWGYAVRANGTAKNGSQSSSATFTARSGTGQSVQTLVAERTVTYNKGSGAQTVSCQAVVNVTGGYHNGTSTARVNMTVPAISYSAPTAPSSCSASRSSDTQARVTWANGSSGSTNPRTAVLIERQADSGGWVQLASLGASVANYTDNGITANHRYAYRVRSQGPGGTSGYSTSGYIYTTPAAPASVTISKASDSEVTLDASGLPLWATGYEIQSRVGAGEWEDAGTADSFPVSVAPVAGAMQCRVRSTRASLASGWTESNTIVTIAPPLAPTIVDCPAGTVATGSQQTVTWARNHPDGSEQTAAEVEYTVGDGDPETAPVEGAASSWAVPEAVTSAPGEVKVRVRTKGLDPDWGAWSSYASWRIADPPVLTITSPAIDGEQVGAMPFAVTWDVVDATGVASQTLRLMDETGAVVHQAEPAPDERSYYFEASSYIPSNRSGYAVEVSVAAGSSLRATALRTFETDYAGPAIPWAEVTYGEDMTATVHVRHGNPGWALEGTVLVSPEDNADEDGVPITAGAAVDEGVAELGDVLPTVQVTVTRVLADGSQQVLDGDIGSGESARDVLPPLNTAYTYLVTAVSEVGTASTNEAAAFLDSGGGEAFNFGADAATCIVLGFDATGDTSVGHSGEEYRFALGPDTPMLPTFFPDGEVDVTGDHSYVTYDEGLYRKLSALVRERANALCWFRSAYGARARVVPAWRFSYDAKSYMLFSVSVSMTEVVWEEPANG